MSEERQRDPMMAKKPFSYCTGLITVTAERCDFSTGVVIKAPKTITMERLAEHMIIVMAYHVSNIIPSLNGFPGYNAIKYTYEYV